MWQPLADFLFETLLILYLPLSHMYQEVARDCFLNVAIEEATGLEQIANTALIPYHYVLAGRKATLQENGAWLLEPRFPVDAQFWTKMALHVGAFPLSLAGGALLKAVAFLSPEVRQRYRAVQTFYRKESIAPKRDFYRSLGIALEEKAEFFLSQQLERRPGDEHHLKEQKECLAAMATLLNEADIAWWLDCGSCLGAYRYGGIIPWDEDIDVAVLLPDFDNVLCALSHLDPKKYLVQDWSGRDHPKSYIKVFLREARTCIDIYHFAIDPKAQQVRYILSLENHIFVPEWWRIRERRFTIPTPFAEVFPLKKALFDGVEVFLPNDPEKYLQRRYGENLAPAKVYNPQTNEYEKDLTHPYWQRAFAH